MDFFQSARARRPARVTVRRSARCLLDLDRSLSFSIINNRPPGRGARQRARRRRTAARFSAAGRAAARKRPATISEPDRAAEDPLDRDCGGSSTTTPPRPSRSSAGRPAWRHAQRRCSPPSSLAWPVRRRPGTSIVLVIAAAGRWSCTTRDVTRASGVARTAARLRR